METMMMRVEKTRDMGILRVGIVCAACKLIMI